MEITKCKFRKTIINFTLAIRDLEARCPRNLDEKKYIEKKIRGLQKSIKSVKAQLLASNS